MILWKEGAERPGKAMVLKALVHAGLVTATLVVILFSVAHYHGRVRPDLRSAAGTIELNRMTTTTSPDSVYGPAKGRGNAAAHYILALNSYAARRVPYLKNRRFKAFVKEPPVTPWEIRELELGAKRGQCDFYEARNGTPIFRLARSGAEAWPFHAAVMPEEERPYYTPFRLLLVGLLYHAKDLQRKGSLPEAIRLNRLAGRVASHIGQKPGCVLDMELAIEIELKAVGGIESIMRLARKSGVTGAARYRKSVEDLSARLRRKYAQLDNPEAAARIAVGDEAPSWRIEAAAALRDQPFHHALGLLERRNIRASFNRARVDSNAGVRKSVMLLAKTQPRAAKDDDIKPL